MASKKGEKKKKNPCRPPLASFTLTITGHNVEPRPIGIIIAGSSVLPSGSAVTISGTPIPLDPSQSLVVGPSSFSMPPQFVFTLGTRVQITIEDGELNSKDKPS